MKALVAACVLSLVVVSVINLTATASRNEQVEAINQLSLEYGPIEIHDLSVSGQTVTYEKDSELCFAKLLKLRASDTFGRLVGGDYDVYFIAEEGAQCASLER
ncbi:hypothetical protein KY386_01280 [Candidatus Parcubacteria bacterium]|nr:hypothetical protein [Candidatus Parcubacteria bacterium]